MRRASTGRTGQDIFEILVREHADMLVTYLRSLVNDTAAVDDLFQETALIAWRRIDDYDREQPFGPWLRGIARNLVLAYYRSVAAHPVWCSNEVLESIDQHFERLNLRAGDTFRDRVDRLLECMNRLPERLRNVIELTYARSMLLRQVATALGEGEEAIKKRVQRARRLLLECMTGSESTT